MPFLIIILFIIIIKKELPEIIKNETKKDLIVFFCFCIFAFTISMLLALGVDIPSPIMPIYKIIEKLYGGFEL